MSGAGEGQSGVAEGSQCGGGAGARDRRGLFSLLLKVDQEEPDISLRLGDLGLDAMVAVEMRAWWKQVFGSTRTEETGCTLTL